MNTPDISPRDLFSVLRIPENRPLASAKEIRDITSRLGIKIKKQSNVDALLQSRTTSIFNDIPVEADAFQFKPFIRTLCDIALSNATQTPLTVAIDGKWGTGKTSVMRMIEVQARLVGLPCVWLNAWSLEDTDNLISTLGAEIQAEVQRLTPSEPQVIKTLKSFVAAAANSLLKSSGMAADIAAQLKVQNVSATEEALQLASIVTARRSFDNLVDLLLQAAERVRNDDKSYSNPGAAPLRLLVFVDDIDRALPDQIVNILKTLRLVLDNKHCLFFLGMDFELVARSVENFYRGDTRKITTPEEMGAEEQKPEFGISYLEKLVQLHVKVPALDRERLENYVRDLDLAEEIIEIIRWAPDQIVLNPRRLKRYINWLSLSLQLIVDTQLPEGMNNIDALRCLALINDYPAIQLAVNSSSLAQSGLTLLAEDREVNSASLAIIMDIIREQRQIPVMEKTEWGTSSDPESYLLKIRAWLKPFIILLKYNPLLQSTISPRKARSLGSEENHARYFLSRNMRESLHTLQW